MKAFADTPEAIGNTVRIAEACNLTIQFEQPLLPRFPLPEGETAFHYCNNTRNVALPHAIKK